MVEQEQKLIGIIEAMVKYGHSRDWYERRMRDGRLETVLKLGTAKKFLREEQLVEYLRQHDGEKE